MGIGIRGRFGEIYLLFPPFLFSPFPSPFRLLSLPPFPSSFFSFSLPFLFPFPPLSPFPFPPPILSGYLAMAIFPNPLPLPPILFFPVLFFSGWFRYRRLQPPPFISLSDWLAERDGKTAPSYSTLPYPTLPRVSRSKVQASFFFLSFFLSVFFSFFCAAERMEGGEKRCQNRYARLVFLAGGGMEKGDWGGGGA